MVPEIGSKPPGFSIALLKIPIYTKKNNEINGIVHFLEIIYHGKNDQYHYIPVTVYQVKNDTVFAQKYIDEDMTTSIQMPMSQLAQPYIIYTTFYLGTDTIGRDILSKLLIGTRN